MKQCCRVLGVSSPGYYFYRKRLLAPTKMRRERLVAALVQKTGIAGLAGPAKVKRIRDIPAADDLVQRKFARLEIDELWVTDMTEHPTREGKVHCCCAPNTRPRKALGWKTPAEAFDEHLQSIQQAGVASTG